MTNTLDSAAFDRLEQLLVFPAAFPLKVMGLRVDHFAQEIATVVCTHIPDFDPGSIEMRASSKGTYLSVTLNLVVNSRHQLESVYKAVSAHPLVKIVL
jgi:uncharacterized protein